MLQLPAGSGVGGGYLAKMINIAPHPVSTRNRYARTPTNTSSCQQSCSVPQWLTDPTYVVRPIASGLRLSPQRLPPGLPCTVWKHQKLLTQTMPPHHFCCPLVLTENMTVPVTLNLPVVPVMLKPTALPTTLTPQANAVREIVATPSEPGNPEGVQCFPVHQSEVIPAGQQLPSQHTDSTGGKPTTSLSPEQQHVGMSATCDSITKSNTQATRNSENPNSGAINVTTSVTNQPGNSSDDECMTTDAITTTLCQNSPAEDAIGRIEEASSDMKQGLQVAKEDKQNSSKTEPGKVGSGCSNHATKHARSNRAVSSAAGKAPGKKVSRKGSKVIINISGTTYFISRKRWRQLHKQWYVLIQCQSK